MFTQISHDIIFFTFFHVISITNKHIFVLEQGPITIVRRCSQKRNTYSDEYSMALSKESESMLDDEDLSIEELPSVDTTEAIDKAALR